MVVLTKVASGTIQYASVRLGPRQSLSQTMMVVIKAANGRSYSCSNVPFFIEDNKEYRDFAEESKT